MLIPFGYLHYGFKNIYWVEGQESIVLKMKQKGIKHIMI